MKPKVHDLVHKSQPLFPYPESDAPVHTLPSYFFQVTLFSHIYILVFQAVIFPSVFPTKTLYVFLHSYACYMHCSSHLTGFDRRNNIWRDTVYEDSHLWNFKTFTHQHSWAYSVSGIPSNWTPPPQEYWVNNARLISERFIYLFTSVLSCGYVKCSIFYKGDGLRLTISVCYSWEMGLNIGLDASFGPGSSLGQDLWWTKWHWGRFFSEYFGFPCKISFHQLLHNHHLSSGAGRVGQLVADVPSGLSLTPSEEKVGEVGSMKPRIINDKNFPLN
jgi:hypothetical protein